MGMNVNLSRRVSEIVDSLGNCQCHHREQRGPRHGIDTVKGRRIVVCSNQDWDKDCKSKPNYREDKPEHALEEFPGSEVELVCKGRKSKETQNDGHGGRDDCGHHDGIREFFPRVLEVVVEFRFDWRVPFPLKGPQPEEELERQLAHKREDTPHHFVLEVEFREVFRVPPTPVLIFPLDQAVLSLGVRASGVPINLEKEAHREETEGGKEVEQEEKDLEGRFGAFVVLQTSKELDRLDVLLEPGNVKEDKEGGPREHVQGHGAVEYRSGPCKPRRLSDILNLNLLDDFGRVARKPVRDE